MSKKLRGSRGQAFGDRVRLCGMSEMLTPTRLGLQKELRKSLASTNMMESVNAVIARASRNVARWRNASMGLRWVAAEMLMAQQGFHRVNGYSRLLPWSRRLHVHENKKETMS